MAGTITFSVSEANDKARQIWKQWGKDLDPQKRSSKLCNILIKADEQEQQQKLAIANNGIKDKNEAFVEGNKPTLTLDANSTYDDTQQALNTVFAPIADLPIHTVITPDMLKEKFPRTSEMYSSRRGEVITVYNETARRLLFIQETNLDTIRGFIFSEGKDTTPKLLEKINAVVNDWMKEDNGVKEHKIALEKVKEIEDRLNQSRAQFLESTTIQQNNNGGPAPLSASAFIESRENEYYQILTDKQLYGAQKAELTKLSHADIISGVSNWRPKEEVEQQYRKLAKKAVTNEMKMVNPELEPQELELEQQPEPEQPEEEKRMSQLEIQKEQEDEAPPEAVVDEEKAWEQLYETKNPEAEQQQQEAVNTIKEVDELHVSELFQLIKSIKEDGGNPMNITKAAEKLQMPEAEIEILVNRRPDAIKEVVKRRLQMLLQRGA